MTISRSPDDETPNGSTLEGDPPLEAASSTALATIAATSEALSKESPTDHVAPVRVYLQTLNTDRSREACIESLRRVARILELGLALKRDCWRVVPWAMLGPEETTFIRRRLLEQGSPATAQLTIAMLKGVLKQAFRLGLMSAERYHRAISLSPIKTGSEVAGRMLSDDEITKLNVYIEALTESHPTMGAMTRALFSCGLGAGLRRDELARLTTQSLSDDQRHLLVRGKGNRERVQPVPEWTGRDVVAWLKERPALKLPASGKLLETAALFPYFLPPSTAGLPTTEALKGEGLSPAEALAASAFVARVHDKPLGKKGVWQLITDTGRAAGLQHFTPHDLRRTFASYLLDQKDLSTVQRLMAHKNPATTVRYDRRGVKTAEAAVEALGPWGSLGRETEAANDEGKASEEIAHPVTGQKLVNLRRVAKPSYLRDGRPADLVWVRSQVAALTGKGFSPGAIAAGLNVAGLRKADGGELSEEDVAKLSS